MIADAYDAMTSTRSYRKALPQEVAFEELRDKAGIAVPPRVRRGADPRAREALDESRPETRRRATHWEITPPEVGVGSAGLGDLLRRHRGVRRRARASARPMRLRSPHRPGRASAAIVAAATVHVAHPRLDRRRARAARRGPRARRAARAPPRRRHRPAALVRGAARAGHVLRAARGRSRSWSARSSSRSCVTGRAALAAGAALVGVATVLVAAGGARYLSRRPARVRESGAPRRGARCAARSRWSRALVVDELLAAALPVGAAGSPMRGSVGVARARVVRGC